ncbi:MAG: hypothetical protein A3F21_00585 [Candidatus Portnoybacteria bacterium RIFCSPLOWO2_01_FULL_38_39]|nr:MAG: hypothetical protein A3F21_00585 [Candidatus Portnoybacteria bacterium RIFCSPLOWO2_01_FULL_38_39]
MYSAPSRNNRLSITSIDSTGKLKEISFSISGLKESERHSLCLILAKVICGLKARVSFRL